MWLQLYNYKNYINVGLGYNRFYIKITNKFSSFLEIDFVIKIHAKRSRRFDLSEAIFKCE